MTNDQIVWGDVRVIGYEALDSRQTLSGQLENQKVQMVIEDLLRQTADFFLHLSLLKKLVDKTVIEVAPRWPSV